MVGSRSRSEWEACHRGSDGSRGCGHVLLRLNDKPVAKLISSDEQYWDDSEEE